MSNVLLFLQKVNTERVCVAPEEWADYNRVELLKVPQWNGSIRAEPRTESHCRGNLWGGPTEDRCLLLMSSIKAVQLSRLGF